MDGGGLVGCRGVKLRVKVIRIVVERDRMKIVEGKKKEEKNYITIKSLVGISLVGMSLVWCSSFSWTE